MKPAQIAILSAAAFTLSLTLTTVSVLQNLTDTADDIRISDLETGNLVPLLCGPALWQQYPNVPHRVSGYFNLPSLLFLGMTVPLVRLLLRRKAEVSLTGNALVSLGVGFLPALIGIVALRTGEQTPREVGAWLAFMTYGLLYASATATVFAAVDLARRWSKHLAREPANRIMNRSREPRGS